MATPLFSKSIDITIDGSVIGCATDFSLSVSKDMIEVACMNSTNNSKQNIPDLYSYTISGSGLVFRDSDITGYGFSDMMSNMISGTADASIGWAITPDVSTQTYFSGVGYFSSLTEDGGVGAAVTYSFEIAGDGDIAISTTA